MRFLKFALFLSLTIFFIVFLNNPQVLGPDHWLGGTLGMSKELPIPAMGRFLSPSEGFWQNAEGEQPNLSTSIYSKKLSAPVKVVYDKYMVPHIFAENYEDLCFAQGYVTASLRLWQMEFQTHAAAGRLTEILGQTKAAQKRLIEMDRAKRKKGVPFAARNAIKEWKKNEENYARLEMYTEGVNAYINSLSVADYPLEYKLMGYAPEPWSTYKTALLLKQMAETLTDREQDLELSNAYKLLGKEKFNSVFPEAYPEQSPIIQDTSWNFIPKTITGLPTIPFIGEALYKPFGEKPPKGIGSNNWAVSGAKTVTGKPILCNDPHLGLTLPSIWFMVQLHCPEVNVYGVALPGAPGVIIGFNEDVAWGVTNVGHDVKDWYTVQWRDETKQEYFFDSSWRQATHLLDTIKVRGGEPIIDTLIYTHIGPVAYSWGGQDLCLRWLAHDGSNEPLTLLGLSQAKTYGQYKEAIKHFACPAQNIIFASKKGDIALWTQGKLPLRRNQQGRFVQDGTKSSEQWQGFIPQAHIPHEHNPERGYIGSANQHSTDPSYPYYYHGYFEEYRGRYLNSKLEAMSGIDTTAMMQLQNDNFSMRGQDFVPLLTLYLDRNQLNKEELEVLASLRDWDYQYNPELAGPVIFETWMREFKAYIYDELDALNKEHQFAGKEYITYPEEWHTLNLLKRDTANFIIDLQSTKTKKEKIADAVTESFKICCTKLPKLANGSIADWDTVQAPAIQHLARIAPFGSFDLSVGGTGATLNAVGSRYDYVNSEKEGKIKHIAGKTSWGPSWRMIVQLGEEEEFKAYGIYPGGQSGNPGSLYYDDMISKWANGQYHDILFMKTADEKSDKIWFSQEFYK